jgi:hypothetical protein
VLSPVLSSWQICWIITLMKHGKKPKEFGPLWSPLFLPFFLLAGALSIPYTIVQKAVMARRERRFTNSMKVNGRTMGWEGFIREINEGHGTLIVERFSFKGPTRMWWTRDNVYEVCPSPLVDWLTMTRDKGFDAVREWCHTRFTSATGNAFLILGNKDEWRTILGNDPVTFRDGMRYVEVCPPRRLP